MDGYTDENVYFNSPEDYLGGTKIDSELWKWILSYKYWDICLMQTLILDRILNHQKNIPHWLDIIIKNQKHDWPVVARNVSAPFIPYKTPN
jgi:esterase/lipase superfamily enzyme